MPVCFQNPGLIPVEAVTTLGVNVKLNDSPIGYFGTGLKYAIAIILRHGGTVALWRGKEPYRFRVNQTNIRGKDFNIVQMNGQNLGFTTELGKNWEMWQAFRELYSNVKDEGGIVTILPMEPEDDVTLIVVNCPEFEVSYHERAKIILSAGRPIYTYGDVEIYNESSNWIYYKGIRCSESANVSSNYTYNYTGHAPLTEDRTFKYPGTIADDIVEALMNCSDKTLIMKAFMVPEYALEWGVYIPPRRSATEEFKQAMLEIYRKHPKFASDNIKNYLFLNMPVRDRYREAVLEKHELEMIQAAQHLLTRVGWIEGNATLKVVTGMANAYGMADKQTETILLSRDTITKGFVYVVGTLLEEYLHLERGFHERQVTDFVMDNLVNFLLEKYNVTQLDYLKCISPPTPYDSGTTDRGGSEEIPL